MKKGAEAPLFFAFSRYCPLLLSISAISARKVSRSCFANSEFLESSKYFASAFFAISLNASRYSCVRS